MNRLHLMTCYLAALNAGFTGYANALAVLYWEQFGEMPPGFVPRWADLPDDRAERDGPSTRISQ